MRWFAFGGLVALTLLVGLDSSLFAAITGTGDVSPSDPNAWTSGTNALVGNTSGGTVTADGGSLLLSGTATIGNNSGVLGQVSISGAGTTWNNSDTLYVGYSGLGSLTISSGGSVSNTDGYIGLYSGSTGAVEVSGAGSSWKNSAPLCVGLAGTGDLTIGSGGSVTSTYGYIGLDTGSTGSVEVSGSGSTWNNSNDLRVGADGTGSLTISNGGSVTNSDGYIGYNAGSTGSVEVSGSGSTWTNSNDLSVGNYGSGSLTINSGGSVTNNYGFIGSHAGSTGTVEVSGSGSTWNNSTELYVGADGTGNLTVSSGGSVSNTNGYIGYNPGSTGAVTVSGSGSTWHNSGYLFVGYEGTGNLSISSGGSVTSTYGYIGFDTGSTGTVEVSGSGSTWNNSRSLYVGDGGTGSLTISNGGTVSNKDGWIGTNTGSTGSVEVSGAGSTWKNSGDLYVGDGGTGSLTISSGGSVSNTNGYIGYNAGAAGTVVVSGTGSTWNNSGVLYVGVGGSGSLTISDGGSVTSNYGYIGNEYGATGTVTVSGAGSSWRNSAPLYVGFTGTGDLTINNGGSVSNTNGYVGYDSSSTGTVTVSGSGSTWNNFGDLYVGLDGSGTVTQNNGNVNVGGTLRLADSTGSNGTYNLNGGTLSVGGLSAGSGTSAFNFSGGTLAANNDFETSVNATLSNTATIDTRGCNVVWDGVLSGSGSLVKSGAGTLTLTGVNSYTGDTDVDAGLMVVNGSITSNVNVGVDGTLGGTGTVANLVNHGIVAPGNSSAVLNVSGNYTQQGGSTLRIETDGSGNCSQLHVAGAATVNGGTVSVGTTGGYKTGTQYTFLTSGGLTVATDPNLLIDSAFLSAALGYDASDMWFTLAVKNNYVDEARTLNQYDVASYLDAHKAGAAGDFEAVLDALNLQSGDGARAAFDAMSGEIYGGLATISIENNERFLRSISQRMQVQSMVQGVAVADNCVTPSLSYVSRRTSSLDALANRLSGWTTWCEGYGVGASLASNGNASGLGYSTGGLIVGMERALDECTLLGFAGGYANSHTTLQSRSDDAEINGGQFSLYLHRECGDSYLTGVAGYGHNSFDVGRSIVFGNIDRTADSNYGGNNYSTYVEIGRNLHGRYLHWQPFGALEYIGVQQNSFTETGANSVDLDVQGLNANAFRSLLGTRMLTGFCTNSDRLLTWNLSAIWRHEFLDDGRVLDASFVGQTDTAFAAYGINVDRDAAIFGTGLNYAMSSHCSLYANYDLIFSRNYAANAGLGGFQYIW